MSGTERKRDRAGLPVPRAEGTSTMSVSDAPPAASPAALLEKANSLLPLHPAADSAEAVAARSGRMEMLEPGQIDIATQSDGRVRFDLVLDLDHTLVHATEVPISAAMPSGIQSFALEGTRTGRYAMRLRDGLHAFLAEVRQIAKLHVYTMGSRSYTRQVLDAIDPSVQIFTEQVLCREDGQEEIFQKSLSHLTADKRQLRFMLVLDDREDAWDAMSREQVLQIPAFRYFRSDGGLTPISKESAPDCALLDCLNVMRDVQRSISSGAYQDVATALHARRRMVLDGVHLVFSGGLLEDARKPERSSHWRLAEAFGAKCHLYWNDDVTHVVSPKASTNTVEKALVTGRIFAVQVHWLTDSCARWQRQTETPYLLRPKTPVPPSTVGVADDGYPGGLASVLDQALLLIPSSMDKAARLKAVIRYLVPYQDRQKANLLFERFDQAVCQMNQDKDVVLRELTQLVGVPTLKAVLTAIGIVLE